MFSLSSAKENTVKFASFTDIQDAIRVCPIDDEVFTYRYLYSNIARGYTIAQYRGGQLVGFLETDNA